MTDRAALLAQPVLIDGRMIGRTVRVSDYEVVAVIDCPDRPWDRIVGRFNKRAKAVSAVRALASGAPR